MIHRLIKIISLFHRSIYKIKLVQNLLFKSQGRECVKLLNDVKLNIQTGDLISNYIFHFGIWEPEITRYIYRSIEKLSGRSFIDIGANIGYFSILVAKNNADAMVYCYEPLPKSYQLLISNIKLNKISNIDARPWAISDQNGELKIYEGHQMNIGNSGIFDEQETGNYHKTNSVQLLDEIIKMKFPPKIIKIDTEGSERKILFQIEMVVEKLPQDIEFIIEINPSLIGIENANEILKRFISMGFIAYKIKNSYKIESYLVKNENEIFEEIENIDNQTDILFTRISKQQMKYN